MRTAISRGVPSPERALRAFAQVRNASAWPWGVGRPLRGPIASVGFIRDGNGSHARALVDLAGVAVFALSGGLLGALPAVLLGVVTAVGGGVIRDVLAREIPMVFKPESAPRSCGLGTPSEVSARSRSCLSSSCCVCWRCDSAGGHRRHADQTPDRRSRFIPAHPSCLRRSPRVGAMG